MEKEKSFFKIMEKLINDLCDAPIEQVSGSYFRKQVSVDKPERLKSNAMSGILIHLATHMQPPVDFQVSGGARDKQYFIEMSAGEADSLAITPATRAQLLQSLEDYKQFLLNPEMFDAREVKTRRNGSLRAYVMRGEVDSDVPVDEDPAGMDALEREDFMRGIFHFHGIRIEAERIIKGDEVQEEFYYLPADMKRVFQAEGVDYSKMPLAGLGL